jgi:hypothetical protein
MEVMMRTKKKLALIFMSVCLGMLAFAGVCVAATIIINFNDGSTAKYDTSQIMSIMFSDGTEVKPPVKAAEGNILFAEDFNEGLSTIWEPMACAGGDYKRFAKFEDGKLYVNVPPNNSWGKTGIVSKEPLFTVDSNMASKPLKIVFDFDSPRTTGYVIALSTAKAQDVWHHSNVWFYWLKTSAINGVTGMVDTRAEKETTSGQQVTPGRAPKTVTLSIYPEMVEASLSDGTRLQSKKLSQLKVGNSVYLYVFSHPTQSGNPSALSLDAIKIMK